MAQFKLGCAYAEGVGGLPKDEKLAVEWYKKAAAQGNVYAQTNLGVCYADGIGVPKDEKLAVEWFRKAAAQDYAKAQNNLGWCYKNGFGVPEDLEKAVYWYKKAAEQGDEDAKEALKKLGY